MYGHEKERKREKEKSPVFIQDTSKHQRKLSRAPIRQINDESLGNTIGELNSGVPMEKSTRIELSLEHTKKSPFVEAQQMAGEP